MIKCACALKKMVCCTMYMFLIAHIERVNFNGNVFLCVFIFDAIESKRIIYYDGEQLNGFFVVCTVKKVTFNKKEMYRNTMNERTKSETERQTEPVTVKSKDTSNALDIKPYERT